MPSKCISISSKFSEVKEFFVPSMECVFQSRPTANVEPKLLNLSYISMYFGNSLSDNNIENKNSNYVTGRFQGDVKTVFVQAIANTS